MAPARHRRRRRYGNCGTAFFRSLGVGSARLEQHARGRSWRATSDAGRAGQATASAAAAAWRYYRSVSATGSRTVSVAIIDYGSGNLHSAAKAFERAARSMEEPQQILVTRDPDVVFR